MFLFLSGIPAYEIPLSFILIYCLAIAVSLYLVKKNLAQVFTFILIGTVISGFFPSLQKILETPSVNVIASLGINLLMFKIGLETIPEELKRVGTRSFFVACIGVIVPFVLGTYIAGPLLFPEAGRLAHIFIGAALTATSVSIPASILGSFEKSNTRLGRTVIGAAVIDDVFGLVILAVVQSMASSSSNGSISLLEVTRIVFVSMGFIVLSVAIGSLLHHRIGSLFARISASEEMKIVLALTFCLSIAALASIFGLASFIGAYCAGLFLTEVTFKDFNSPGYAGKIGDVLEEVQASAQEKLNAIRHAMKEKHVEEVVHLLIVLTSPVFFLLAGMKLDMWVFLSKNSIVAIFLCSLLAIIGKVVAGLAAHKGERLLVGIAMVPRGEVGLIFAAIGQGLGVLTPDIFSMLMGVILTTTLITPLILGKALKSQKTPD